MLLIKSALICCGINVKNCENMIVVGFITFKNHYCGIHLKKTPKWTELTGKSTATWALEEQ